MHVTLTQLAQWLTHRLAKSLRLVAAVQIKAIPAISGQNGKFLLFNGIRKDIALQKLVLLQNETALFEKPRPNYELGAQRLQTYTDEPDKN